MKLFLILNFPFYDLMSLYRLILSKELSSSIKLIEKVKIGAK